MDNCPQNLAFSVISKLQWEARRGELNEFKISKDKDGNSTNFRRDLTEEELNAVISENYPLRIITSFDERAWPIEFENFMDFVEWTIQLQPKSTIKDMIEAIKKMPCYGGWECNPPRFCILPDRFKMKYEKVYLLELVFGT